MAEDLTGKIKSFFKEMGCEALVILKTPRAGEEVDDYHGGEFNLPEYAVIYKGDPYKKNPNIVDFEFREKTNFMLFDIEGCKNVDGIIDELEDMDSYKVTYKSETVNNKV